ncbi:MAG: WD40 repeat domain-containing protein, partial [Chloroflexi bacterium]
MTAPIIFEAHVSYVLDLLFSVDSQTLVSAGMDNFIKFWSVPDGRHRLTLKGHTHSVNSIALSPDGNMLASGSTDATVKLWSFPQGELQHTLQDRKKVVAAVRFSPNGEWVAAGSYGGRVALWSVDGRPVTAFWASRKNLSSIAFSPDSRLLATAGLGGEVQVWAVPSGEKVATLTGHSIAAGSLKFLRGGKVLASMGYNQELKFWDTALWAETRTVTMNGDTVRGVVFSPDEQRVAVVMEG